MYFPFEWVIFITSLGKSIICNRADNALDVKFEYNSHGTDPEFPGLPHNKNEINVICYILFLKKVTRRNYHVLFSMSGNS